MNPIDHPHGGGEGRTSGGRHPVSPWGKPEGRTQEEQGEQQAHRPSPQVRQEALIGELEKDMPRSLKGPFVDEHLAKKVDVQNEKKTHNVIKTWSRRSMIIGHDRAHHRGARQP